MALFSVSRLSRPGLAFRSSDFQPIALSLTVASLGLSVVLVADVFPQAVVGIYVGELLLKAVVGALVMIGAPFLAFAALRCPRSQSLWHYLRFGLARSDLERLLAAQAVLAALLVAHGVYSLVKRLLPLPMGFAHDVALADLDRWLHFGVDPWRLLHALLPPGPLTPWLEVNYLAGWGVFCMFVLVWICLAPEADRSRTRHVAGYLFSLVGIGLVFAFLGISAGPIFFDRVTPDTLRFSELDAFIEAGAGGMMPVVAVRDFLWQAYATNSPVIGTGISAFPSVHVALTTFGWLLAREHSPRLGWLVFGYLMLILFSSVYLGWHYAVDGYVSIVAVSLFYAAARRIEDRVRRRAPG